MIGAIIGDIVGSPYEGSSLNWVDDKNFPLFADQWSRFTDDTILTCATADALLNPETDETIHTSASIDSLLNLQPFDSKLNFAKKYKSWAKKYPGRGYGSGFQEWVDNEELVINNSYANGAMMRCSPIGMCYTDLQTSVECAFDSIWYTHNSLESVRGVQSITCAIHMAKNGMSKSQIKSLIEENFGHMLDLTVEDWRNHPKPNIRCNLTAPQALVCFMESTDYESAIRNAVYTKGDTDTIAAIAGSIAEAFYGVHSIPKEIIEESKKRLPEEMIKLINEFYFKISDLNPQYKNFQI